MSDDISAADLGRVAVEAARVAGQIALSGFRSEMQVRLKGHKDIVTQFDTAAEDAAIRLIKERFPHHGFIAEESGPTHAEDDQQPPVLWAIDPIDGTHNYAMQLPFWCSSVAAVDTQAGRVVAGAVFDPLHNELFSATQGSGAYLNGQPIHVGTVEALENATFAYDLGNDPGVAHSMLELTQRLQPEVRRVRLMGSAVLAMAYVAAGRFDGYFHMNLQPWDIAAASLLVGEAGGLITNWQGGEVGWRKSGVAAGNRALQPKLLEFGWG